MRHLLLSAAIPFVCATSAFAGGHMASFPEVTMEAGTDFFGSDLIGMRVYQSENDMDVAQSVRAEATTEWDDIGEIGDLIIGPEGTLKAVIVDVGGFLGLGEKEIAVTFDQIKVLREEDGEDRFLVLTSQTSLLEEAPQFERMDHGMAVPSEKMSEMTVDRTPLRAPTIERDGYLEAKIADLTAEDILGTTVYGSNDENVGEISQLIMSDSGMIERAVIDVGGFLGLGEKPVAVTFEELKILRDSNGSDVRIYIDASETELEAQPEYEG